MAIKSPYAGQYFCTKCKRTKSEKEFYGSNDMKKYPSGKINLCKECATMHIDNWNQDTYLWLLKECDVPYIPTEWVALLQKYAQDRRKVTGATIMGRYLAKMHLKQYRDYRWGDSDFLQEIASQKIEASMKASGNYSASEIAQAVSEAKDIELPEKTQEQIEFEYNSQFTTLPYPQQEDVDKVDDEDVELSDDDVAYLKLKWGKSYKPHEWVQLEKLYTEMLNSYDIHSAGAIDTLKFICKTSLKANQLLDLGD